MKEKFSENPLISSLMPVARMECAKDLTKCYFEAKAILEGKSDFEETMAEIFEEIEECQKSLNPGTSFVSAGLLLCLPHEDHELIIDGYTREDEERTQTFIKAAIAWKLFEKHKVKMS